MELKLDEAAIRKEASDLRAEEAVWRDEVRAAIALSVNAQPPRHDNATGIEVVLLVAVHRLSVLSMEQQEPVSSTRLLTLKTLAPNIAASHAMFTSFLPMCTVHREE